MKASSQTNGFYSILHLGQARCFSSWVSDHHVWVGWPGQFQHVRNSNTEYSPAKAQQPAPSNHCACQCCSCISRHNMMQAGEIQPQPAAKLSNLQDGTLPTNFCWGSAMFGNFSTCSGVDMHAGSMLGVSCRRICIDLLHDRSK
jgi:hypothetical protein